MKEKIHVWLDEIEKKVIVPQYIIALNFGLYDTEKGYCIYLVGAREYDDNNDSWAEDAESLPNDFFIEIETNCKWEAFQKQVEQVLSNEIRKRKDNPSSVFTPLFALSIT